MCPTIFIFYLLLAGQLVKADMRSFIMSVINGRSFQCANTTCLPFNTVTVPIIRACQKACLAEIYCQAASFQQSSSKCDLFSYISNHKDNISISLNTVTMFVVLDTRIPPGNVYTACSTRENI